MIHKADVRSTLTAYDPNATPEQVDSLYQQMVTEWEETVDDLVSQAEDSYHEKTGDWPDGPQRGAINQQAKQLATDLVMGAYLEPMTQEIVARQLEEEEEEDNPHLQALQDPDGWWKDFGSIQASREAEDAVLDLWMDEPAGFQTIAMKLFERRLYLGKDLPASPNHPEYQEIEQQIRQAVGYWKTRIPDFE
ncbi:hypothetical protein [Corynebacterium mayonis]|uniref:hypothetical protein n=1 Tax=Corynebacterium mayonis TaxID=3062461 RepID=UPI00313FF4D1